MMPRDSSFSGGGTPDRGRISTLAAYDDECTTRNVFDCVQNFHFGLLYRMMGIQVKCGEVSHFLHRERANVSFFLHQTKNRILK